MRIPRKKKNMDRSKRTEDYYNNMTIFRELLKDTVKLDKHIKFDKDTGSP